MTEALLHYLWRNRLYNVGNYFTIQGESLSILHPGFMHHDAGPDFKQAIIKIDEITWAGDVELHLRTSDWNRHKHANDEKYNRVVLHVVYEHDEMVKTQSGREPAIFELKPWIRKDIEDRYVNLFENSYQLPCSMGLSDISQLLLNSVLTRVSVERLARRDMLIRETLQSCEQNWQETFFRHLLIGFGFKTNAAAFEQLGRSIPYRYLQRHLNNQLQTYAFLFGQAGMLIDDIDEEYVCLLSDEYLYLQQKYRLLPISGASWNLLRLRPQNFPGIRLAQVAELLHQQPKLFKTILQISNVEELIKLFRVVPHPYWKKHYVVGSMCDNHSAVMGKNAAMVLIINVVIPFLYSYGSFMGNLDLQERAFAFLEALPYENNSIASFYKKIGFASYSALHSQAVLELSHYYCQKKRCLECGIGQKLIT